MYWINNLLHGKTLDCNETIYKKYGLKKATKDFKSKSTGEAPWLDQENHVPILKEKLAQINFSESIKDKIKTFAQDGYMILEKAKTFSELKF